MDADVRKRLEDEEAYYDVLAESGDIPAASIAMRRAADLRAVLDEVDRVTAELAAAEERNEKALADYQDLLELTGSRIAAMQAEVDRVTRERDAILRWAASPCGREVDGTIVAPGKCDYWAKTMEGGYVTMCETPEAAIRKAAGLDGEGG